MQRFFPPAVVVARLSAKSVLSSALLIGLLLLAALPAPAMAGFPAGLEAYQRGDYATAMQQWRPLAEQGNARAQRQLGLMYDKGQGVVSDYVKAVHWWRKAAGQGDPLAQDFLGVMYLGGIGTPADEKKAKYWRRKAYDHWLKAVKAGNAQAAYRLYFMFVDAPPPFYPNHQRGHPNHIGIDWRPVWKMLGAKFREMADKGDPKAMLMLSDMYRSGVLYVGADRIKVAEQWMSRAAKAGSAQAQYLIGLDYQQPARDQGKAASQRAAAAERALAWLNKAAGQGHAGAMASIGVMYQDGDGTGRDLRKAMHWFGKAAKLGSSEAQHKLGEAFRSGFGVPRNQQTALHWFGLAAHSKYASRMRLGQMYENGIGTAQDLKKAVYWYRKAAEQHHYHEKAKYKLGLMYVEGRGVGRDLVQAYMWFLLSTRNPGGHEDAERFMAALAKKMKPAEVAKAKQLAAEWYPK